MSLQQLGGYGIGLKERAADAHECSLHIFSYTDTWKPHLFLRVYTHACTITIRAAAMPLLFSSAQSRRTQAGASTTVVFCSNAIICHGVSRKSGTAMAVVAVAVDTPLPK